MLNRILEAVGVSKGTPKQTTRKSNGSQPSPRKATPARTERKRSILQKREEIPAHESVLTGDGGSIVISEELKKHYVVLLESRETQKIIIVCSSDIEPQGIDNNYLYIKNLCKEEGYKIFKKVYAVPGVIGIIYEQGAEKTKAQKKEDKDSMQGKVFDLLGLALEKGASDVHIEVRNNSAFIRFRINSKLTHISDLAIKEAEQLAGLIYRVIAKEKDVTFNPREQQSAIIDQEVKGTQVRVRLNTMPAYPGGFDMVMRVLRMGSSTGNVAIEDLGYSEEQIRNIKKMVAKPTGVIIVAGVTGSGKSTTNSVLLKERIQGEMTPTGCGIKVITVEDPPEYEIAHTTQVPVNSNKALPNGLSPFAAAMKAALRCDPDILMVGEVRDAQSADLLVHTVQSGHQVFTTLHAQSAFSIVPRLAGIDVPHSVLGSTDFISGLIYQTLVPIPCNHCSISYDEMKANHDPSKDELFERLENLIARFKKHDIVFRNKAGCSECSKGIVGMTVVAETIVPTEEMVMLFGQGKTNEALFRYREDGGEFVVDHGIQKVLDGLVCPMDAEHRLGPLISTKEVLEKVGIRSTNREIKEPDQQTNEILGSEDEIKSPSEFRSPDLGGSTRGGSVHTLSEKINGQSD